MNSDILLGKWRKFRGYLKQSIGKFSGDSLLEANGIGDRMQGTQQENSGYTPKSNPTTQEDRKVTHNQVLLGSDHLNSN